MLANIESDDLERQLEKLKRSNEIIDRHVMRAMSDSAKLVARVAAVTAPGSLSGSFTSGVQKAAGGEILGRVASRDYRARWVEFGTKAHGVGGATIAAHAGLERNAAYVMARAIRRGGTRGRHFLWRAFKASQRGINQFMRKALERVVKEMEVR